MSVSHGHRRIEITTDLYNLNLLVKLMVLIRRILFHPAIAAVAEAGDPDVDFCAEQATSKALSALEAEQSPASALLMTLMA